MAYTWHLTVSSYRARSRLPARFFSPLHFFRLYYYVGPFLAFSSVDSTKRVTETTCVVFINAKRRNNVIANFRRKSVFKNFSRESWKRRREAGKSWRSRKIFAEPQESRPAFEPTNATATESSPSTMPRVDRSRSHCFALTFSQCCISSKPFFLLHAYIRLTGLLVCVCFRVPAAA